MRRRIRAQDRGFSPRLPNSGRCRAQEEGRSPRLHPSPAGYALLRRRAAAESSAPSRRHRRRPGRFEPRAPAVAHRLLPRARRACACGLVAKLVGDPHQRRREILVEPEPHCAGYGRLGRPRRGLALAYYTAISRATSAISSCSGNGFQNSEFACSIKSWLAAGSGIVFSSNHSVRPTTRSRWT